MAIHLPPLTTVANIRASGSAQFLGDISTTHMPTGGAVILRFSLAYFV
jgi:hypothetical protein